MGILRDYIGVYRTEIIGFQSPNTIDSIVFGPYNPFIWILGPFRVHAGPEGVSGLRVKGLGVKGFRG